MNITIHDFVNGGTDALVIGAVLMALYNAFTRKLQSKINSYRLQTLALALVALLKANITTNLWFYGVASILFIQILVIARFLAYVTNVEERKPGQSWISTKWERTDIKKARSIWLEYNLEYDSNTFRANPLTSLIISSGLIAFAYFVAYQVAPHQVVPQFGGGNLVYGLGASLALLLVGLFIMINAHDILSQIMGLLVMENGLFLAAVIFINDPALVFVFLVTMFAWYTLTWVILLSFLPRLRQFSRSIYVKDQRVLKE